MNLSQILIEAGVTPDDLNRDCKFIAQDGGENRILSEYSDIPNISKNNAWFSEECYLCENLPRVVGMASDWKTPLSREQFIADYATHLTIQMNQDK
jgi:hypothetical protein